MKRLLAAATLAALAACTTTSPNVVSPHDAQQMSTVLDGVVLSTRPVVVEGSQSGLGGAAGSVVGGIAGANAGGYRDAAALSVIGAVFGGMIGNAMERFGTREQAVELLIQMRNGERRSVVQAVANEILIPGDSVVLVNTGGRVRVAKAPVVVPAPAATAPST